MGMSIELKKELRAIRQEAETEIIKYKMYCEGFSIVQNQRTWLVVLIDQWTRRDLEQEEDLEEYVRDFVEGWFIRKEGYLKGIGMRILSKCAR